MANSTGNLLFLVNYKLNFFWWHPTAEDILTFACSIHQFRAKTRSNRQSAIGKTPSSTKRGTSIRKSIWFFPSLITIVAFFIFYIFCCVLFLLPGASVAYLTDLHLFLSVLSPANCKIMQKNLLMIYDYKPNGKWYVQQPRSMLETVTTSGIKHKPDVESKLLKTWHPWDSERHANMAIYHQ